MQYFSINVNLILVFLAQRKQLDSLLWQIIVRPLHDDMADVNYTIHEYITLCKAIP